MLPSLVMKHPQRNHQAQRAPRTPLLRLKAAPELPSWVPADADLGSLENKRRQRKHPRQAHWWGPNTHNFLNTPSAASHCGFKVNSLLGRREKYLSKREERAKASTKGRRRSNGRKLIKERSGRELRRNLLRIRTINRWDKVTGAPSLEISQERLGRPGMVEGSCLEQGGGLEDLQGPFQLCEPVIQPWGGWRVSEWQRMPNPLKPRLGTWWRKLRAGTAHQGHAGCGVTATPPLLLPVLVFASANLIQFGWIIEHLTGKHAFIYNGYGCYCGWGGSRQPVDATDWCCQAHDCCYQALSLRHCKPKVEKYFYSVGKDTVTCGGETECRRQTCECDKAAALCFRRSMFQDRYICYPNHLCQGPTPPCQDSYALKKGG